MGPREAAEAFGLRYNAVDAAAQVLEERGLLRKDVRETDRRRVAMELTDVGADRLKTQERCLAEFVARVWEPFGKDQMNVACRSYFAALYTIEKMHAFGNVIRGDSSFLVFCTEFGLHVRAVAEALRLGVPELYLTVLLGEKGALLEARGGKALPQCETCRLLVARPAAVSKAVASLAEAGSVQRVSGKTRRSVSVCLNAAGAARYVEAAACMEAWLRGFCGGGHEAGPGSIDVVAPLLVERLRVWRTRF